MFSTFVIVDYGERKLLCILFAKTYLRDFSPIQMPNGIGYKIMINLLCKGKSRRVFCQAKAFNIAHLCLKITKKI